MPIIVPNFIALGQMMYEKRVTKIFTLVNFGAAGDPLGRSSPVLQLVYCMFRPINVQNFVPFWQPMYEISAPKLRWFRWQHDRQTRIQTKLECGPMPNVMVALPNIGGALCSTPQSLAVAHYYMPCSNATKTRNPLKFAGVPQTTGSISAASEPKCTIL